MKIEDLVKRIQEEKQKRDTVILAHTYQAPEIIDVADITGDSFALSKAASRLSQKRVILCGVRFMAETVKILSPEKEVILPNPKAECPMATQIEPSRVKAYKEEHPGALVVAYINTTSALKAECDVCVTSSTAVQIVEQLDAERILFLPDQNLGSYVQERLPDKRIELWSGYCPIHDTITEQDVLDAKEKYPDARLAMHPECRPEAARHADLLGSTSAIIQYILSLDKRQAVIVGTERGVADYLCQKHPDRDIVQLCGDKLTCPDMKLTSLVDVYRALIGESGEKIELDETLRLAAKRSIDNMLRYGG